MLINRNTTYRTSLAKTAKKSQKMKKTSPKNPKILHLSKKIPKIQKKIFSGQTRSLVKTPKPTILLS